MYLRHLQLRNLKRIRDLKLSFEREGEPRMWTVLIGENGLCKTTILQAIALLASGEVRANQLAQRQLPSYPDSRIRRRTDPLVRPGNDLSGLLQFSTEARAVFDLRGDQSRPVTGPGEHRTVLPEAIESVLQIAPFSSIFGGSSMPAPKRIAGTGSAARRPVAESSFGLSDFRGRNEAGLLVVGYGTHRVLPRPMSSDRISDPALARLQSLFDEGRLIGTGFADLLDDARRFAALVREALVASGLLPGVTDLELRGRGGVQGAKDLVDGHRFTLKHGGESTKIPAVWLSQGYQSTVAWVADLIGQAWLDQGGPVPPAEIEALVLIDELDLHLHPRWQVDLIPTLKKVFPRVQFVVTTHSPMVLPGLEADEIIYLEGDAEGNVVHRPIDASPALMTGSQIYRTFFGIDGLYPNEAGAKLQRYGVLASDPNRDAAADAEVRALRTWLKERDLDPGWAPVPRRKRARRAQADLLKADAPLATAALAAAPTRTADPTGGVQFVVRVPNLDFDAQVDALEALSKAMSQDAAPGLERADTPPSLKQ